MRPLTKRDDGCELFEITSIDELDLAVFLPMVDEAWKHDYRDEARQEFDESVLRKLTPGCSWVAVLACSADGAPVGFELALERRLRVRERALSVYYASVFTVSAEHRRKGIGSWVLQGINRLVFEERKADLIVSTLQRAHAGSPTVQATFDRIEGWGVRRLHESRIWSRRLDKEPLPPVADPAASGRLAIAPKSADDLRLVEGSSMIKPPSLARIDDVLRDDFDLSFALEASLSDQYLNADIAASGMMIYDFLDGERCLVGFNTMPLSINERRLRPIGQLQFLVGPGLGEKRIGQIVHQLALDLANRGCFALSLLDMGMVPTSVLESLGFATTGEAVAFSARGPLETLALFDGVRPPFFVDFT